MALVAPRPMRWHAGERLPLATPAPHYLPPCHPTPAPLTPPSPNNRKRGCPSRSTPMLGLSPPLPSSHPPTTPVRHYKRRRTLQMPPPFSPSPTATPASRARQRCPPRRPVTPSPTPASHSSPATTPRKRRRSSLVAPSSYPLVIRLPQLPSEDLFNTAISLCGLHTHSLLLFPRESFSIIPSFHDHCVPNIILTHPQSDPPASPAPPGPTLTTRLLSLCQQLLPSPSWRLRAAPPPMGTLTPHPLPATNAPAPFWPLLPLDRARARWLLHTPARDTSPPAPFDAIGTRQMPLCLNP